MANDMGLMLANDTHLKPLLHILLGEYDPKLAQKDQLDQEDWEYIESPDGSVASFRLDVVAGGRAGGINIIDGYIRTLAHCLKQGKMPPTIKVISIINHSQVHWTSSIAEIQVDPDFYQIIQSAFVGQDLNKMSIQGIVNQIYQQLHPDQDAHQIDDHVDMKLYGAKKATIKHYDSHNANPKRNVGAYYYAYMETLDLLLNANNDIGMSIQPAPCKQQKGNTCGDNSLWNGYMGGVLGLSPEEEYAQMDSEALRAFAEHNLEDLRGDALDSDVDVAIHVRERVQFLVKQSSPPPSPNVDHVHDHVHDHSHDHVKSKSSKSPDTTSTKTSSPKTTSEKVTSTASTKKSIPKESVVKPTSTKKTKPNVLSEKLHSKSWLPSKKERSPIPEKEKQGKQVHFQTLKSDVITYQPISKIHQQAFEELFSKYGKGKNNIKNGIKAEYESSVTEKYAHGILQRINATIGSVFTKKRNQQMDQLATVMDKLQQERVLNNHEKGVILRGVLYDIIDDIRLNEPKNAFKSRMLELCQQMNLDMNKMSISQEDKDLSKKLCHVYLKEGFEKFREVAAEDKSKPSNRKKNN